MGICTKHNKHNEITKYKMQLVAQDFSQRPSIDYGDIYSLVMDVIMFKFLIIITI